MSDVSDNTLGFVIMVCVMFAGFGAVSLVEFIHRLWEDR